LIKKNVVEADERESGLRRVLNFGHTVGHGIESTQKEKLYHGECVALGIIPMCDEKIRPRVIKVLEKCKLYRTIDYNWEKISEAAFHDKKADGDTVFVVRVNDVGTFEIEKAKSLEVVENAKKVLEGLK
jgi:3-dehydroquinate synthase